MSKRTAGNRRLRLGYALIVFVLTVLALAICLPFYNAIVISFETSAALTGTRYRCIPQNSRWIITII